MIKDLVEIAMGFSRWDFTEDGFGLQNPNASHLGFRLARNPGDEFFGHVSRSKPNPVDQIPWQFRSNP